MSDEKNTPAAFDWGDDPEHIVSVQLGDDVVRLEIRDPFSICGTIDAYSASVSRDTMGDFLGAVWPDDIGDGSDAFAKVFPQYPMSDLQVALVRVSKRVREMFPTTGDAIERAAFFPVARVAE